MESGMRRLFEKPYDAEIMAMMGHSAADAGVVGWKMLKVRVIHLYRDVCIGEGRMIIPKTGVLTLATVASFIIYIYTYIWK